MFIYEGARKNVEPFLRCARIVRFVLGSFRLIIQSEKRLVFNSIELFTYRDKLMKTLTLCL